MLKKNYKKILNKKTGFTVIESLVAIFILVISLTGPMVFSQSGLRASFISRDQITAFFLAQDAIEYVKNVRDDNVLKNISGTATNWLADLEDCFVEDAGDPGCSIDTLTPNVQQCNSFIDGCITNLDDSGSNYNVLTQTDNPGSLNDGVMGLNRGEDSIFARHITIEPVDATEISNSNEVEISIYIRWNTPQTIGVREIVVKENMFNWASGI